MEIANRHRVLWFAPLLIAFSGYAGDAPAELPVHVAPDDPNVLLIGRFDHRDKAGPRCAWPGSSIRVKFSGTNANAVLKCSGGADYVQVIVDDKPTAVLKITKDQTVYSVCSGLTDGEHTLEVFKRTEASVGTLQFLGLQLEDGKKLLAGLKPAERRIELIGDSITCGYGNEGANEKEHFKPETENNYLCYGPVASRQLNADCIQIAWSGKKLAPNNTIVELYDYALPNDKTSTWEFSAWVPQAVMINLGTNDFGKENPEEKMWTGAYTAFIQRIRKNYPQAHIFCAIGTMMSDNWPKEHKALSTVRGYIQSVIATAASAGDTKVHLLEFGVQDGAADGLGADYHPNLKTDQKMATKLAEAIKKELGW